MHTIVKITAFSDSALGKVVVSFCSRSSFAVPGGARDGQEGRPHDPVAF